MQKFTYLREAKEEKDKFIELVLSKRFFDILNSLHKKGEPIAGEFISCNKKDKFDISFIDVTDKDDFLSYITASKAKQVLDKFKTINREQEGYEFCWINNRQEQRITRVIPRLFGDKFNQKQIEEFVHEFKAALKADHSFDKFEIVEGEDIKKYYSGTNYSEDAAGQLQRSCMKYDQCRSFFELYIKNPTKMKMLVLKQNDEVIYGRANLWFLDEPEGRVYMDRIYTTYDWQIKLFIDYAIKNDYIFKSKQIYGGDVIPVIDKGKKERLIMSVNLKPEKYSKYPYVDTLQFYNPENGNLTSDIEKFHDKDYIALVMANGDYFKEGKSGFGIDNLGRIVLMNFLVWSEMDKVHIHKDNAIELRYRGRGFYVTQDHDFINIYGEIYLKDDVEWNEEEKVWNVKKNI